MELYPASCIHCQILWIYPIYVGEVLKTCVTLFMSYNTCWSSNFAIGNAIARGHYQLVSVLSWARNRQLAADRWRRLYLHPDKHLKEFIVYNYLTFWHEWHSHLTSLWLPSQHIRKSQAVPAVLDAIDFVVITNVLKGQKAPSRVIANINVDFVGHRTSFPCYLHRRLLQQRATTCSNEDQVMQSRLERATLRQNAC